MTREREYFVIVKRGKASPDLFGPFASRKLAEECGRERHQENAAHGIEVIDCIKPEKPMASHEQRKLLFRVYGQVLAAIIKQAAEIGEDCPLKTTKDVHEAMKVASKVRSTKDLTRWQMTQLTEWVCAYWTQRGVDIDIRERAPGEEVVA